jgi:hypothetical protein
MTKRQTFLSRLQAAVPHQDDSLLITVVLTGEDEIPCFVDCPIELWYSTRRLFPGEEGWKDQWVYWKLDEWGFLLGEIVPFDKAVLSTHMACGCN